MMSQEQSKVWGGLGLQRQPLQRSDILLALGYWLIALFIIYNQNSDDGETWQRVGAIIFNVLFDSVTVYVLLFIIFPSYLPSKRYIRLFVATVLWLMFLAVCYREVYGIFFDWKEPEWSLDLLLWSFLNHLESYAFLAILLLGKRMFDYQQRYLRVEKEKRENELRMLKAQVDPHFLFNNLNILDALIPENPALAQSFLRKLSNLYRYLLRHKDEEIVLLEDELNFARDYIYLLHQRFADAYKFKLDLPTDAQLPVRFLPPGALQTLIENIVKHNAGNLNEPLMSTIRMENDSLWVENEIRLKHEVDQHPSGTGLRNLKARYALLTDIEMTIERSSNSFLVRLPLLQNIS